MRNHPVLCSIFYLLIVVVVWAQAIVAGADSHERMMQATFKLIGESSKMANSDESAAAFVVELPGVFWRANTRRVAVVTAGHFFDNIQGQRIELVARKAVGDGRYEKVRHPIRIGRDVKVIHHPDEDIDAAVFAIDWPEDFEVSPVPRTELATTITLQREFQTGRETFALGYPFAIESGEAGFPLLRCAHIASYPAPGPNQPTFLLDMNMSHGFSGSPVYVERADAAGRIGGRPLVLGMIVGQHELTSEFKGPFETRKVHYPLDLAIVVPGPALHDLVNRLLER